MKKEAIDFKEVHASIKENQPELDVCTDESKGKEFDSIEKLHNFYKEQNSKTDMQLRAEAKKRTEAPITVHDVNSVKMFLMTQVNLLPNTDGYAAIKHFYKLKIINDMNNEQIANFFRQPVSAVNLIEAKGMEIIKEYIHKSKRSMY